MSGGRLLRIGERLLLLLLQVPGLLGTQFGSGLLGLCGRFGVLAADVSTEDPFRPWPLFKFPFLGESSRVGTGLKE